MTILIDEDTGEMVSLTVQDRAAMALAGKDYELTDLAARSAGLVKIADEQDYKEVQRARTALVTVRTGIAAKGKMARDDANAFSKAVISEEKRLIAFIEPEELRLKAMQNVIDDAKRIEAGREAAEIEAKFQAIKSVETALDHGLNFGDNSMTIMTRIDAVTKVDVSAIEGQRKVEFELKKLTTLNTLNAAFDMAKKNEAATAALEAQQSALSEKADADMAEQLKTAERTQKLANAPDADKLIAYRDSLMALKPPAMETVAGMELMTSILTALTKLADRIEDAARSM